MSDRRELDIAVFIVAALAAVNAADASILRLDPLWQVLVVTGVAIAIAVTDSFNTRGAKTGR